ncbi:Zn2Cys6 transcription factor [Pyrenophora tritici-repentis]|nr:Zn2Cys6 transcription factor [Pyrenophora tritici-repentis]
MLAEREKRHQKAMEATAQALKDGVKPVVEEKKEKTDAEIVEELRKQGKNVILNDEGQIADKSQLLKAGLNIIAKPKPASTPTTTAAPKYTPPTHANIKGGRNAQRERQTAMIAEQIEAANKRKADEEAEEQAKIEHARKSQKTASDISSAKESLTCRKRRVKCDEGTPTCKNCERVDRECVYAEKHSVTRRPRALSTRKADEAPNATEALPSTSDAEPAASVPADRINPEPVDPIQSWIPFPTAQPELTDHVIPEDGFFLDDSLFTFGDSLTPNFGPVEWYDLLAEDAINNMQGQTPNTRWNFDVASLSRRQSPRPSVALQVGDNLFSDVNAQAITIPTQPWNTETRIELKGEEVIYYQHYVNVVAPVLDLFDPERHFANVVPHLALRNVGLLKSILAVGACHMALYQDQRTGSEAASQPQPGTPASTMSAPPTARRMAEQFYYETLHYLSQNLMYQSYTVSREILTTGIMISTYEMFGTASNSDHSNWDRHLRGAFWIQKNSGTSGESVDGLQRAVWWAWLRQDIWAAFRTGRPALTIHQPKIPMSELSSEGLATRIIYIAAKCVQFAATPKQGDITGYIEAGETLLRMLDAWKRILPPSFEPIPVASTPQATSPASATEVSQVTPIWIHPPAHAAAIQMYHFAKIIMILNQPSTGGLTMYQTRFKLLRESTSTICGIAMAEQAQNLPSAFVSFQAIYAAALCAETQDRQHEILEILRAVLNISKFPSVTILDDLVNVWGSGPS